MRIEDQLRDRLKKVEALYFGAATAGERDAAEAAAERLKAKFEEVSRRDPPIEMKCPACRTNGLIRLFIALCRRYGIGPFRYPRQRARQQSWSERRGAFSIPWCGVNFLTCTRTSGYISSRLQNGFDPGGYPCRYC